ncbi:MAG: DUF4358 domain-containing protein [Ruminococcaceae bacterium]|nr:DUF4358 domain-containing protein [Oscillospiraceae bacterium]
MKKILVLLLAGIFAASALTACGNEAENTKDESKTESVTESKTESKNESVAESKEDAAVNIGEDFDGFKAETSALLKDSSFEMPAEAIYNDVGIDPQSFAKGFWLCEESGNSAETVAVYIANSEAEGETIRNLLGNKLTSLQNQYKDYNQDNYEMTLSAVVGGTGVYAYIVISPNAASVKDYIEAAIKG